VTPADSRRALITGATGFIGCRLAESLRGDGWNVVAVARPTSAPDRVGRLRSAGCTVHVHDGTLDALRTIVAQASPSCTWHLAAKFVAHHESDDVLPLVEANIAFGAMLLEALCQHPNPRLVTVGSHWQQYGNAEYAPVSLYAATKQAFGDIARFHVQARGLTMVTCLMTDTYGAGDPRHKLLWQLQEATRTGTPLAMSDGSQLIDLVHVDDAVRALRVAGTRAVGAGDGQAERWAVRSGQSITVRQLVERFAAARGTPIPVTWGARAPRPREMRVPWTTGEVLPGWTPTISLDEGLKSL
jgi:nucleoside-diphosphate-sugar epimerase